MGNTVNGFHSHLQPKVAAAIDKMIEAGRAELLTVCDQLAKEKGKPPMDPNGLHVLDSVICQRAFERTLNSPARLVEAAKTLQELEDVAQCVFTKLTPEEDEVISNAAQKIRLALMPDDGVKQ